MGEVFAGRYELIDPIGRGGAGAVWRAWDHRRRRYVAAKVLMQSDAHTLLRFVREQALRIDHPHVLAPASWAADDDKVLFTMDLVAGGSLAHVIGDYGPLPPRFVCTLLDQLLAGLAAVHAEGVVHRDIKPANILMAATGTGRPHLRLSDFGISLRKGEPRLTETNYVVGTPGYSAPEQLLGAEPDFPADFFATGLVALYLLQGRKPDAQALVERFLAHGTPDAPEGVPAPLWDVIANLPDPQSRFRTATGARKALAEAVELLPPAAPDEEPVEVFDQIGPLPDGFGPRGPQNTGTTASAGPIAGALPHTGAGPGGTTPTDPRTSAAAPPPDRPPSPAAPAPVHTPTPSPAPSPTPAAYAAPPAPLDAFGPPHTAYGPSSTGSFHLPPPAAPEPVVTPLGAEAPYRHTPPTRPATAAPTGPTAAPGPTTHPSAAHPSAAPRAFRIAPPPPRVTAGILAAALLCFAVGVWALTRL